MVAGSGNADPQPAVTNAGDLGQIPIPDEVDDARGVISTTGCVTLSGEGVSDSIYSTTPPSKPLSLKSSDFVCQSEPDPAEP